MKRAGLARGSPFLWCQADRQPRTPRCCILQRALPAHTHLSHFGPFHSALLPFHPLHLPPGSPAPSLLCSFSIHLLVVSFSSSTAAPRIPCACVALDNSKLLRSERASLAPCPPPSSPRVRPPVDQPLCVLEPVLDRLNPPLSCASSAAPRLFFSVSVAPAQRPAALPSRLPRPRPSLLIASDSLSVFARPALTARPGHYDP